MKIILQIFFWAALIFSCFVMANSAGWLLVFSGIIILPLIVLHIIAGVKSFRRFPLYNRWIFISILSLLIFALVRPDFDDLNAYTGLSTLLYQWGITGDRYIAQEDMYYYLLALVFGLAFFVLDILIIVKKKEFVPNPPEDFV
jgi:hypothetical protein